ncbi:MAG: hypothetical protein ABR599_01635 [Gemmatimonadota bacterium]
MHVHPASASPARPPREQSYPLPARFLDLFLDPGALFEELRLRPRVTGALALSSTVYLAALGTAWVTREPSHAGALANASPAVLAAGAIAGLVGLWSYLLAAALLGLAFGGFVGRDLPYRSWLALSAHCSLVAAAVVPIEMALATLMGSDLPQPDLAELLRVDAHAVTGAFLARLSLRSAAFLGLFSAGAAAFSGVSFAKALAFFAGTWSGLWFALAWFIAGIA